MDFQPSLSPEWDERIFRTFRPNHPIVQILESENPGGAFLDHMRELLVPNEWEFASEGGFTWIPYRLSHRLEILQSNRSETSRYICRSSFVILEELDENLGAEAANYFNQRPCGAGVYFDGENRSLRAVSSVELDPVNWWNAFLFSNSVIRQIGIWENIAPRAPAKWGGRSPDSHHPEYGLRQQPDQFLFETSRTLQQPEAGTGLWFSRNEIKTFRAKTKVFLNENGLSTQADQIKVNSFEDEFTSAEELRLDVLIPLPEEVMAFRIAQSDHPDLGRGIELLGTSSLLLDGGETDYSKAAHPGLYACHAVSLLNAWQADWCPAPLNIGGWTSSRGQIAHTSFIDGETIRQLMSIAHQNSGVILSLLLTDNIGVAQALTWCLAESALGETRHLWTSVDPIGWRGVEENAGLLPLLVGNGIIERNGLGDALPNELFNPVEIEGLDGAFQHSSVAAIYGIFDPINPYVGTVEFAIDYEAQLGLLIERIRNPFQTTTLVWAVLDKDGYQQRAELVADVIGSFAWPRIDWIEVADYEDDIPSAVIEGLLRYALNAGFDPVQRLEILRESQLNPWCRPSETETVSPSQDPEDFGNWIATVMSPQNIDTHTAFLRSAWEAAIMRANAGPERAQNFAAQLINEIEVRREIDK